MASIRSTCTHTGIRVISDDGHQASARAVSVVQLVFIGLRGCAYY